MKIKTTEEIKDELEDEEIEFNTTMQDAKKENEWNVKCTQQEGH